MTSTRIVVADDHPVVRRGVVALLESEPDLVVVAEAADGREASELALDLRPDVVVMDLRMPVMDGVEAVSRIRSVWPEVSVLVLTTYDTDEAIVRSIEAGALGFMLKDAPPAELVDAVRRAAVGESVWSAPVERRISERVQRSSARVMSAREIEVLRAVADGNTNSEIGRRLHISQATVKTHLLHIYDKLDVSDRAAAVSRAYETGVL